MKMYLKIENESYEVELGNLNERPIQATVNGEIFQVTLDQSSEALPTQNVAQVVAAPAAVAPKVVAPAPAVGGGGTALVAPIPGVIDSIKVREGDSVTAGQELIVLEAMKMKNSLRATRAGKVGRIFVSVGDQVPHNHVLLEFAD